MAKNNEYFFPRFATIKVTIKCVQNPSQNNEMYTLSYEYQGNTISVTFPINYESGYQPLVNNLPSSGKLLVFRTQKWAGTVTNLKVTY